MSKSVEYCLNKASEIEIANHLLLCEADFVPPLSGRVEIGNYAHKIADKATRFEAWVDGSLVGLVAAYCNDTQHRAAYITSVSVLLSQQGKGIALQLMRSCIENAKLLGFESVELQVDIENAGAIRLYQKLSFKINVVSGRTTTMQLNTR